VDGGVSTRVGTFVNRRRRNTILVAALALTLLIGLLDYLTGPELASLLFYLVPLAIVGLAGRTADAVAVGVLAGACWFTAELLRGRHYDAEWILFWNGMSRLVVFVLIGTLLAQVQAVRTLKGVPGRRCSFCGSEKTIELQRNLVCLNCRRVFTGEDAQDAG
jgi:hypothetical protein